MPVYPICAGSFEALAAANLVYLWLSTAGISPAYWSHLFRKTRLYGCQQIRNTEAEMDPPCADVFRTETGVAEMEYGVVSGVNMSPPQMELTKPSGSVRASL